MDFDEWWKQTEKVFDSYNAAKKEIAETAWNKGRIEYIDTLEKNRAQSEDSDEEPHPCAFGDTGECESEICAPECKLFKPR